MSCPQFRVLGPIQVTVDGVVRQLSKRRHREIVGILLSLRGGVISTQDLIAELWDDAPPAGAVGAVRTFVGELRRIIEPNRLPRSPAKVLVTVGDGYSLRLSADAVDAWRFEAAVESAGTALPEKADSVLSAALAEWQGEAFEEFAERPWSRSVRTRLGDLRFSAVERCANARLAVGRADEAVPLLEGQVTAAPWREEGWALLALALYRSQRQGEALAVLRTARMRLRRDLGVDPGPALSALEIQILRRDPNLELPEPTGLGLTAAAYSRSGTRAQLEASNAVLGSLAVTGDVKTAQTQRIATIRAAQSVDDAELTARIIGGYDIPGIWTRSDNREATEVVVAAAEHTLASTARISDRTRARLLATIAMESRGTADRQAEAQEAESIATRLGDEQLHCFALSARFMQEFHRTGLAKERADIGAQLTALAISADSPTFEINGRLIRMQALCALDDIPAANAEADAVDELAARHERPLAAVFTGRFRSAFIDDSDPPLPDAMPGFTHGLAALTRFTREMTQGSNISDGDFGPYEPWVRPLLMLRADRRQDATHALRTLPAPPNDLLLEVTWCVIAQTAVELGEAATIQRAFSALAPAGGERAAGSGVVDLGNVKRFLELLEAAPKG
ncbi:BTAD domain-containing putative transcriptional regulator [Paenarthrobacter sp. NPDC091711]|uniref:AfsR/SARP family transcriptional regulator n=1 Tax=Paenarthrobacter sp. NPDC091711 TaxID=3364385 RepID=UPI003822967E